MRFSTTTIGAALLLCAAFGPAAAGPTMDWDPAFMWQVGATPTNSPAGGEFKAVGIISMFDFPLQDLDASDPTTEYTFYAHGLISQGTVASGPPTTTFYTTNYTGGSIEVYAGSPRNAVFDPNPPNTNVPSTFIDGTAILTGVFTRFVTQTNNFTAFQTGNAEGDITWTGGTMFERVLRVGGEPCPGLFTGGMTWNPSLLIPGYLFRHDGKIDHNCPTSDRPSTWGLIKALYR